jgi:hypothetical protein
VNNVLIKDIPFIEGLSDDAAKGIAGGMMNLREENPVKPAAEPTGGMGYTGIMIHYTLTVIE